MRAGIVGECELNGAARHHGRRSYKLTWVSEKAPERSSLSVSPDANRRRRYQVGRSAPVVVFQRSETLSSIDRLPGRGLSNLRKKFSS
jgi:hypothetical protein